MSYILQMHCINVPGNIVLSEEHVIQVAYIPGTAPVE